MLEVKITCEPNELGAHLRGLLSAGSFQGVPFMGGPGASTKEPYLRHTAAQAQAQAQEAAASCAQEPLFKVGQIVVRKREPDAPHRIVKMGAVTLTLDDGSSSHIEDFEIAPPGSHAKLADAQDALTLAPTKPRSGRPAGAKNKPKPDAEPERARDNPADDEADESAAEDAKGQADYEAEQAVELAAKSKASANPTASDPAKDFETAMAIVRKLYDDPDQQEAVVKLRDQFEVKKFSAIPDDRRTEFLERVRALEASAL